MISSISVPICNHFHVRQANNASFSQSFVGTPFNQWHEILSRYTRDSRLSYGANQKSLSHLGSNRYRVVTDRQTPRHLDRITIANTCYALARKNETCCRQLLMQVNQKFFLNLKKTILAFVVTVCGKKPQKCFQNILFHTANLCRKQNLYKHVLNCNTNKSQQSNQ